MDTAKLEEMQVFETTSKQLEAMGQQMTCNVSKIINKRKKDKNNSKYGKDQRKDQKRVNVVIELIQCKKKSCPANGKICSRYVKPNHWTD